MQKPRPESARTCVGCRELAGKQDLIRVVRRSDGGAAVDLTGRAAGRGAYLHPQATCVASARKKRSLDRALRTTVQPELWTELVGDAGLSPSP
ncbi:MAG TPA: YlxR family protein [Candidatus Eisenbacteria bacterium]|nr:YlxR family protein [Candidatus Eisenbacteria bacterium]